MSWKVSEKNVIWKEKNLLWKNGFWQVSNFSIFFFLLLFSMSFVIFKWYFLFAICSFFEAVFILHFFFYLFFHQTIWQKWQFWIPFKVSKVPYIFHSLLQDSWIGDHPLPILPRFLLKKRSFSLIIVFKIHFFVRYFKFYIGGAVIVEYYFHLLLVPPLEQREPVLYVDRRPPR